jgi:hypothetical protein
VIGGILALGAVLVAPLHCVMIALVGTWIVMAACFAWGFVQDVLERRGARR